MKKILFLSLVLLLGQTTYSQNNNTSDTGVVIDGIRWATRNVYTAGTFAEHPESYGGFFNWTSRNVCPEGWRVPTRAELHLLHQANSVWTTRNGVNGRLFGNAPNQIFLPAVGDRDTIGMGRLNDTDNRGFYWSDSKGNTTLSWILQISNEGTRIKFGHRARGFSIRCVAE